MRDHSHHIELSRDDAVHDMLEALPESFFGTSHIPFPRNGLDVASRVERVSLDRAFGQMLAQDVETICDVPNVLTCCLDSIALHWSSFEGLAEGELPDTSQWKRGVDWDFANTGVAMPEGFDTAVVVEHVEVAPDEDAVALLAAPSKQYAGTRQAGSKMKRGDVVAKAGALITPDVAAAIASAGHDSVFVLRPPRVAFIATGDELVMPGIPFSEKAPERFAGYGHVFESNSMVVQGKVEKWGGVFVPFDITADSYECIKRSVAQACAVADIVVLNAGSSKGSDDWCVEVLEEMGQVICHQTNHGPGHHSSYALIEGVPVVGISGPSGGASFTLNFYLQPLMRAFLGQDPTPQRIPAVLNGPLESKYHHGAEKKTTGEQRPPEATEPGSVFYSIRFMELDIGSDGVLKATPVPGHAGSPATQHANAYYMMPAGVGVEPPHPGDIILVELR